MSYRQSFHSMDWLDGHWHRKHEKLDRQVEGEHQNLKQLAQKTKAGRFVQASQKLILH